MGDLPVFSSVGTGFHVSKRCESTSCTKACPCRRKLVRIVTCAQMERYIMGRPAFDGNHKVRAGRLGSSSSSPPATGLIPNRSKRLKPTWILRPRSVPSVGGAEACRIDPDEPCSEAGAIDESRLSVQCDGGTPRSAEVSDRSNATTAKGLGRRGRRKSLFCPDRHPLRVTRHDGRRSPSG